MPSQPLVKRVDRLEMRVTALEQLPERVDELASQISHLRNEMRVEFSAIRTEIRDGDAHVIRDLEAKISSGDEETRRVLRQEIHESHDDLGRQMRMLHEDVVERLKVMQDGRPAPPSL